MNLIDYVCIVLFSVYRMSIRTAQSKCKWGSTLKLVGTECENWTTVTYLNWTVLSRSTRNPSNSRGNAAASFPTLPRTTWLWIDKIRCMLFWVQAKIRINQSSKWKLCHETMGCQSSINIFPFFSHMGGWRCHISVSIISSDRTETVFFKTIWLATIKNYSFMAFCRKFTIFR